MLQSSIWKLADKNRTLLGQTVTSQITLVRWLSHTRYRLGGIDDGSQAILHDRTESEREVSPTSSPAFAGDDTPSTEPGKDDSSTLRGENVQQEKRKTVLSRLKYSSFKFSTKDGWANVPYNERPKRHKTTLSKYQDESPNIIVGKVLESNGDVFIREAKEKAAASRSARLQLILVQLMIRRDELRKMLPDRSLLDMMPQGEQRRECINVVAATEYTKEELGYFMYILEAEDDMERCKRFFERDIDKPIFFLNFLLRRHAAISDVTILSEFIAYMHKFHHGHKDFKFGDIKPYMRPMGRSKNGQLNMDPKNFTDTIWILMQRCHAAEPRLILGVVEVVAQYLKNMGNWDQHPQRIQRDRSLVFNQALKAFAPSSAEIPPNRYVPTAYLWEAQRSLLALSASFETPLLVNRDGFSAVREVLTSLNKNETEIRSSMRHKESWPPYLEPADGIDEALDPEDSWTRSVQAGAMMQEAGYPLGERDDAMNTLQGLAPDGTPTIQQRVLSAPRKDMTVWEASIKATRNSKEAWARFNAPPKSKMKPGLPEYTALFSKFIQRQGEADAEFRPGDRKLSYATRDARNLTAFELIRLQPPSVDEVYQQMLSNGIKPAGACLRMLISHASGVDQANKYLQDSDTDPEAIEALVHTHSDADSVRRVNLPLFSAYVHICCIDRSTEAASHMLRAIGLCQKRFEGGRGTTNWIPRTWGHVLKGLARDHTMLRMSLAKQLDLFLKVLDSIESKAQIPVSTLVQFCKCLRRVARKELDKLDLDSAATTSSQSLMLLYDPHGNDFTDPGEDDMSLEETKMQRLAEATPGTPLSLFMQGATRVKQLLRSMADEEKANQEILQVHGLEGLERMWARRDVSRAEDAYQVMLSLAYMGEYEEMARFMNWLTLQWSDGEVTEALHYREFTPRQANFLDTLCVFRLFAEPMLDAETMERIYEAVTERALWDWPNDDAVEVFLNLEEDGWMRKLSDTLEWVRRHRKQAREVETDGGSHKDDQQSTY